MTDLERSSNWAKAQTALQEGRIHSCPVFTELPTNLNWDYSVILKTGHTWGAKLKKDGKKIIFLNIQNKEIHQANIVAWEKHKPVEIQDNNLRSRGPFSPHKDETGL